MVLQLQSGGALLRGKPPFSDLERNRIYDLKANILKIKGTDLGTFFAFAQILSTMDADQLGDFTDFFVGSESRF